MILDIAFFMLFILEVAYVIFNFVYINRVEERLRKLMDDLAFRLDAFERKSKYSSNVPELIQIRLKLLEEKTMSHNFHNMKCVNKRLRIIEEWKRSVQNNTGWTYDAEE